VSVVGNLEGRFSSVSHHHWLQFVMPLALPLKSSVILSLAAINQGVDFPFERYVLEGILLQKRVV
jgi:hypothetical protein